MNDPGNAELSQPSEEVVAREDRQWEPPCAVLD